MDCPVKATHGTKKRLEIRAHFPANSAERNTGCVIFTDSLEFMLKAVCMDSVHPTVLLNHVVQPWTVADMTSRISTTSQNSASTPAPHSVAFSSLAACSDSAASFSLSVTQCSTTPDAIASVLLAGDAVLNLSGKTLNAPTNTPFVQESQGRLLVAHGPHSVSWRPHLAPALRTLISQDISRIVVVGNDGQTEAAEAVAELSKQSVPISYCVLSDACQADDFMDEADAEAVAERLRQLGYL
jgi:hypothetical protein